MRHSPSHEPGGAEVHRLLKTVEDQALRAGLQLEPVRRLRHEFEESQQSEAVLEHEARHFRSLVENAADVIARFDRNLRCLYVNPALELYTGMSAEHFMGKSHREAGFPEALCHLWEIKLREVLGSGKKVTFEFAFAAADGNNRWHECWLVPEVDGETGQVGSVMCVGRDISRIKAAEETQRQHEQQWRQILEQCPSALALYDRERRYQLVNLAGVQLSGLSEAEHLGRLDEELWPPEVTDGYLPALKRALAEGQRQVVEWTMPPRFGRHTLLITYVPLFDANEKVQQVLGIAQEITASKDAQEALRVSRDRLALTLEAGRAGMVQWDLRTHEIWWNAHAFEIHGYAPYSVTLTYEFWRSRIHPEDLPIVDAEIGRCFREHHPDMAVNYRIIRPSGEVRWLQGVGRFNFDAAGIGESFTGIALDVTEQHLAEERLAFMAQGSALLASTLDPTEILARLSRLAVPYLADFCVIYQIDSPTTYHLAARAHRRVEMEPALDRIGEQYVRIPAHPDSRIAKAIRTGEAQLLPTATLVDVRRATDDPELLSLWLLLKCHSCIVVPLAARGRTLGVMFLFMAESPQVYGPEQVREAQDLGSRAAVALDHARLYGEAQSAHSAAQAAGRAKDHFIAVLSHELRTPLTPVMTTVQFLQRDAQLSEEQRASIELIERNVLLEVRLIDDLLDLTRIQRGKLELHVGPVDVHSVLGHVADICQSDLRSKQLEFTVDLTAGHHHVQGDSARLQQVFWNLLKNAIKFTPRGGRIQIRSTQVADDQLAVSIQDTGVGIEPSVLPAVFNAFEQGGQGVTRLFGGLGLGLSICRGLVDLHGGKLAAESAGQGQGATFTVLLPTSQEAESVQPHRPSSWAGGTASLKGGRLLLVEDHPDTMTVMTKLLRSYGYEVHTADTVASAHRAVEAEHFDLLLCDIGLPDGSGLDLMRQLAARQPIKAIALSGFGTEDDVARSKAAGFKEHLVKPVDIDRLEQALDRMLAQAEPAPPSGDIT